MDLNGRVAIVTGGGTGIGRAVALRLAKAGAKAVVVNYSRSDQDARSTAAEINLLGRDAMAHKADISNEGDVKAMIAAVRDRYGRLDILINNAGTTRFIPHPELDLLTDKVWDDIFKVNVMGTFYCCRAAAPELRKSGGTIVNIASIAAHRGTGSSIAYAVSKAAVLQLTRGLAVALAPDVRVNSVSPGLVSTRWLRQFDAAEADSQEASTAARTPLNALATTDHVAQAVMAFVENDMLTGQDVVVDGGRSILY
ncbi:MAG TPA: SDR family oxidoreductase [Candidatus Dormibacteraeota bacterium]|jgi:NAD(P)-dependent dehydrogenase (short-subunit alcohol dehydrogenase family)